MPNIQLQDLTAIIHNTSSYNGDQFDLVHVETLLLTSEPLPPEMNWYVPDGTTIPPEAEAFFGATNIAMYPMFEDTLLKDTSDIQSEAQTNQFSAVLDDAAKLLMRSVMKKSNLALVTGTNNLYRLSYDYKLFHLKDVSRTYDFKVCLPFDGLGIQNGGAIQMAVNMPLGATIDAEATKGQAPDGTNLEEQITTIAGINRNVVSFRYQQDPLFTIRYHY